MARWNRTNLSSKRAGAARAIGSGGEEKKGETWRSAHRERSHPGGDLRSHTVTRAVSSALRGLTTVFGMGTGVTPAVWPPGNLGGSRLELGRQVPDSKPRPRETDRPLNRTRAFELNQAGEPQIL